MDAQLGKTRLDFRNAMFCAGAVLLALLCTWPFVELPFNDDWTYAFTVKRLLETGHILYNGWSSPSVITQSYWALLWVKAFGFSFTVLRLSTMPLAMGCVALTYLLARRAQLPSTAAVFAAVVLGLSPLFLPLATSFMSDVPGCFCILLSVYAMVRSAEAGTRRSAVGWLAIGVVVAIIGGSSRQIVYIVPMALAPYVAWLRRRDRVFIASAGLAWAATLGVAILIQHWFERQPFSLPEPTIQHELKIAMREPVNMVFRFVEIGLTLLLLVLPATSAPFAAIRKSPRRIAAAAAVLILIGFFLIARPFFAFAPWLGNLITPFGIYNLGDYHAILIRPVRFALAMAVFATIAAALVAAAAIIFSAPEKSVRRGLNGLLHPGGGGVTVPALLLVTAGYLALLFTRCALDVAYDRHLLPLIPCVTIPLLAWGHWQSRGSGVTKAAWAVLAIYGLFGIAATQESIAHARARVEAARRLTDAGIARAQIDAGYEYNYWTEALITGYINDSRIQIPPGAFKPGKGATYHVDPLYKIEFAPTPATEKTSFGTVEYFSLLPPMHRQVSIDRYLIPPGPEPFRAPPDPLLSR